MAFFDKLYTINDPSGVVSDKILAYINENFRIIEMTLNGKLSSANIIDDGITDGKISSADDWNEAKQNVSDIMSDSKLTSVEASQLRLLVKQLVSESTDLITMATSLSITTEIINYSDSLDNLVVALDPYVNTD